MSKHGKIFNTYKCKTAIEIGANCLIDGELLIFPPSGRIIVGDWCYLGKNSRIWANESLVIGNRVLISHNVNIFDSNTHPINPRLRHEHFRMISKKGHIATKFVKTKKIIIKDDVWIGANTTILMGVTIGEGAIIGANSVVLNNVAPYTIVVGNPAVFKKNVEDEK